MLRWLKCLLLILLLCFPVSTALAKRSVDSADYQSAGEFLADIEIGTKVTYDGFMFLTKPYVDEDTFCASFVLLPWTQVEYSPTICIYASEEDLADIPEASALGTEKNTFYVHVTGVSLETPVYDAVYISVMDGQGSIVVIEPEAEVYCLDEIENLEEFKSKAINYLDKLEIRNGTVTRTDDTNAEKGKYKAWISCGSCEVYIETEEKQFFVGDQVQGTGTYEKVMKDDSIFLWNENLVLVQ